jgi:hypothetical protein
MRKIQYCIVLVLVLFFSILQGCRGHSKPDGFPPIYDCSITLTQEGKPLVNATLILFSEDGHCSWSVGGTTDKSGVAKIFTHGLFPGAPAGTFLVTVSKTEADAYEQGEVRTKSINVYTLIDKKFSNSSTTPLEIIIKEGKNNQTFDLGTATRTLFESIAPNEP